ncbi:hypothetical protein QTO30_01125 [Yoonia sp. GPGPB17]|uniref:hypothetical protein n=1 Tax=Yoonia sp. GPGPB17 TaxID=3026147 RepID=UPI0030BD8727
MKRLFMATVVAILPIQAMSDDAANCVDTWAEISEFTGALGPAISEDGIVTGHDGWCQIVARDVTALGTRLEEGVFRLGQLPDDTADTRSIEVALTGLQTPLGLFEGTAALSVEIETDRLRLHQLRLFADDGRGIRATADMAANKMNVDIVVTLTALATAGIDFSEVSRVAVDNALRDVNEMQVSGKTRREFLRFVGAAPNAQGTLSVSIQLSDGTRIAQIAAPFFALGMSPSDDAIARAFDAALTDVRVDIVWKPGRM